MQIGAVMQGLHWTNLTTLWNSGDRKNEICGYKQPKLVSYPKGQAEEH